MSWCDPCHALVVVTCLPPALRRLLHHPMLNTSHLAMHLLKLDPTTPEAPNVFLNLACLFAFTQTLLLVTGTPKLPPSSSIASLSITHLHEPVIVRGVAPGPGAPTPADKRCPALSPIQYSFLTIAHCGVWSDLHSCLHLPRRVLPTGTRVNGRSSSRLSLLPPSAAPWC